MKYDRVYVSVPPAVDATSVVFVNVSFGLAKTIIKEELEVNGPFSKEVLVA